MALELLGASDARVEFGACSGVDAATQLTVAIWITPDSPKAGGTRVCGRWGGGGNTWLVQTNSTGDRIEFYVSDGSSNYAERTATSSITLGALNRIVLRWDYNSGSPIMNAYINGSADSMSSLLGGTVTALNTSTVHTFVGHEVAENSDGIDGDYAEFAVWTTYLSDAEAQNISNNYAASWYPTNGVVYVPLTSTTSLADQFGSNDGTQTGGSTTTHPTVTQPTAGVVIFRRRVED